MWNYHNPSKIIFKTGILDNLKSLDLIPKKKYCIFTYPDKIFKDHIRKITDVLGAPLLIIDEISPNPDYKNLEVISKKYQKISAENQQIVCLGGGSVIDSAKFIAFGLGDFNYTVDFLEKRSAYKKKVHPDLISIPTTAGTGSELTSWATIWDSANQKKYSLAHECLYSKMSIFDSNLMLTLPKKITLEPGLDAMSHAFESIWNINSNPLSNIYAIKAIKIIMEFLPKVLKEPININYREMLTMGSMYAGLAFSNTKTAISHNISYPITLKYGVPHGIACSFTLPTVLKSIIGIDKVCDNNFKTLFGQDLEQGPKILKDFFKSIDISTDPKSYIGNSNEWDLIVSEAFEGERGKNFIGNLQSLNKAQDFMGL